MIIRATGLRKSFGRLVAVAGLDVSVDAGEIVGLLGPNGAGKTTTLNMLIGALKPDAGEVRIDGLDVDGEREAVMEILGFVPDVPEPVDTLRGREVIDLVAELRGLAPAEWRGWIAELAGRFDFEGDLDKMTSSYSRGTLKKLALLEALIHRPRCLILDEPVAGFDPMATRELIGLLGELRAAGTAVLYSTHVLDHAARICDRLLIIAAGEIIAAGGAGEIIASVPGAGSLEDAFVSLINAGRSEEE